MLHKRNNLEKKLSLTLFLVKKIEKCCKFKAFTKILDILPKKKNLESN